MIQLGKSGKSLTIRVVKGSGFSKDRDLIRTLPGRAPIWGINNETKNDEFKYFEISPTLIGNILSLWTPGEIIASEEAQKMIDKFSEASAPLDSLDTNTEYIHFIVPPKPHQEAYIRISKEKTRLLCAFKVQRGKTYAVSKRAEVLGFEKLLIISPQIVCPKWRGEIKKFLGDDVILYRGTPKQRKKLKEVGFGKVVAVSYDLCHELADLEFNQIILDEGQLVAHHTTDRFKGVAKIVNRNPDAGFQIATGTPVLNKPRDLWALVHLISPELAGDYKIWCERYEKVLAHKTIHKNGRTFKIPIKFKTQNLDELHEKLKSIMVRIDGDEITNFEDRIEVTNLELDSGQRNFYRRVGEEILLELADKRLQLGNVLTRMLRLQQASEGLFHFGLKESSKLEYIKTVIDSGEKVIIWSMFKKLPELICEMYPQAVLYTSDVNKNRKLLHKVAFQGAENPTELEDFNRLASENNFPMGPGEAQVFTGTISHLSSLGITLDTCSRQIVSCTGYSPTALWQALGRIKSFNQLASTVYSEFLLSEQTIDKYTLDLILTNLKNIDNVVDGKNSISYNQTERLLGELRGIV